MPCAATAWASCARRLRARAAALRALRDCRGGDHAELARALVLCARCGAWHDGLMARHGRALLRDAYLPSRRRPVELPDDDEARVLAAYDACARRARRPHLAELLAMSYPND